MGVQNLSEDIILVVLPEEPHLSYELDTITEIASGRPEIGVVIDFARVEMLTSESVCSLMILNKLIGGAHVQTGENGCSGLVLCDVSSSVRRIFTLTGLETVFTFAEDKLAAVELLQSTARAESPMT